MKALKDRSLALYFMKKERVFITVLIVEINYLALKQNLTVEQDGPLFRSITRAFKTKVDFSFGMMRTEYHCAKCGVYHGHVFNDGPTKQRRDFAITDCV